MLKNYLALVGLQGVGAVLAVAFLALVAVAVTPQTFGTFSLALSVAQIVATIGLAWTNSALLRFAREEIGAGGTMGTALGSRLLIQAVLLLIIVPLLVAARRPIEAAVGLDPGSLRLIILALFVISLFEMGTYAAQAVERFSAYGIGPVILKLAQIATLGLFLLGVANDWQALMIGTIAGYGIALTLAWRQIPRATLGRIRATARQLRRILAYSWAVPMGSVGGVLVIWMDLWFLRFFADLETVGVYAWAYSVALFASALFVPLGAVIAPRIIDLRVNGDTAGLQSYARAAASLFFLAASVTPVALAAAIALFWLANLGTYQAALAPLLVLLAATLFQLLAYLINPVLSAFERLMPRVAAISLVIAVVNAGGNWFLIGPLGVLGPAIATAVAFGAGAALMLLLAVRATPVRRSFPATPVLVAGAVLVALAAAVAALPPGLAIAACLVIAIAATMIARQAGAYRGMAYLAPLVASFPAALARPVRRAIGWLDNTPVLG